MRFWALTGHRRRSLGGVWPWWLIKRLPQPRVFSGLTVKSKDFPFSWRYSQALQLSPVAQPKLGRRGNLTQGPTRGWKSCPLGPSLSALHQAAHVYLSLPSSHCICYSFFLKDFFLDPPPEKASPTKGSSTMKLLQVRRGQVSYTQSVTKGHFRV